ncbi:MAG TPA: L,D-transpeptidase [Solirubrobacter sp.]|nr:L,D-transpeptidase [Solirubrobacter sp.]
MGAGLRAAAVTAVAFTQIADPAGAALSATGGEPADPRRSLIAEVPRGATVTLHATPGGRTIARLSDRTVFGSRAHLAVVGNRGEWLAVSTETPGDRRRAWIRRAAVRLRDTSFLLMVSLSERTLELRRGTTVVFRTTVAVGSRAHPTPTGRFGVTDKLAGPRFGSVYGCCILALSAIQDKLPPGWPGGNRIALHGTNSPAALGQPVSTGCVRVAERPLRALMRRVPLGTPVLIED